MENYVDLNAQLNLLGPDGGLQLGKDHEAVRAYFLQHVNQNMVWFHNLREKLDYLIENNYYMPELLEWYDFGDIKKVFKKAYSVKFRFQTFLGALKFFTSYSLKTDDGSRYLERFEDRVAIVSLALSRGNVDLALDMVDEIISGRYQPATPTFMNAGRARGGEQVSCFLLRTEDSLESIMKTIGSAAQLSKRGGGVGILLTNIREQGAPIKGVKGASSGVIPYMKVLEDLFSYVNQLGTRQGAGVCYINVFHPDILSVLDTKRENADEKVRIKTLSIGVVVPDIAFELAKSNADMYLFSPYDVEKVYGVPMSDISITDKYHEMVEDSRITKTKISARKLFQTIAELQFESGYPYLMFEDTANRGNPLSEVGRINMSNLCSEISQINTPSTFTSEGEYDEVGRDISCNLGSLNVSALMKGGGRIEGGFGKSVETAMRALTSVVENTSIDAAPTVRLGNEMTHSVGLGVMNLAGYFGEMEMEYGGPKSLEFTSLFFELLNYHSLVASNKIAVETGEVFSDFDRSTYADGSYFDKYVNGVRVDEAGAIEIFEKAGIDIPTVEDWKKLQADVMVNGLYHGYRLTVPPTGSISYINNSTSSIHPIISPIEIRKEGRLGRVYYPAPGLTESNLEYFKSAFDVGPVPLIDVYSRAQEHIDQSLSLTLFFSDEATTRDLNKAYIYAWKKGIKTLYYTRIRQKALEGTSVDECVSCVL